MSLAFITFLLCEMEYTHGLRSQQLHTYVPQTMNIESEVGPQHGSAYLLFHKEGIVKNTCASGMSMKSPPRPAGASSPYRERSPNHVEIIICMV